MPINYKKVFSILMLMISFINFSIVSASTDVNTSDLSGELANLIGSDPKSIKRIIKSNKKLIKHVKGLSQRDKSVLGQAVEQLDNAIEKGLTEETIENNLDNAINDLQ